MGSKRCIFVIVFICLLLVVLLFSFKIRQQSFSESLDVNNTNVVKGIFLVLVFLGHSTDYFVYNGLLDIPYIYMRNLMGQTVVTFFLFCSGYGVMESIKRNVDYVDSMFKNRFLKVLCDFDIVVTLFLITNLLFGNNISFYDYLLACIAWGGLGNSNWYIFCILWCYFSTVISFKVCRYQKNVMSIGGVLILCVVYILWIKHYKETYWWDTILCYPVGMLFAYYKVPIIDFLKNKINMVLSIVGILMIAVVVYKFKYLIVSKLVLLILFALFVVLIVLNLKFENSALEYIGENLFGFYILQRIPMMVLKETGIVTDRYVFVIVSFLLLLPLNYIVNKGLNYVRSLIF